MRGLGPSQTYDALACRQWSLERKVSFRAGATREVKEKDVRKQDRGASSPANPAFVIPELRSRVYQHFVIRQVEVHVVSEMHPPIVDYKATDFVIHCYYLIQMILGLLGWPTPWTPKSRSSTKEGEVDVLLEILSSVQTGVPHCVVSKLSHASAAQRGSCMHA